MSAKKIVHETRTETEKLVERINTHGIQKVAKQYDTHPSTLSRWLRSQGFRLVRQYVKQEGLK